MLYKFNNIFLKKGNKSKSFFILRQLFILLKKRFKINSFFIFFLALNKIRPFCSFHTIKRRRSSIKMPRILDSKQSLNHALKFLCFFYLKKNKNLLFFLYSEIILILLNKSNIYKYKKNYDIKVFESYKTFSRIMFRDKKKKFKKIKPIYKRLINKLKRKKSYRSIIKLRKLIYKRKFYNRFIYKKNRDKKLKANKIFFRYLKRKKCFNYNKWIRVYFLSLKRTFTRYQKGMVYHRYKPVIFR